MSAQIISLNAYRESRGLPLIYREPERELDVFELVEARFGPDWEDLDWYRAERSKRQLEPYIGGCVHNVVWRTKNPRRWNRPMPFPVKVHASSDELGRGVPEGLGDPLAWTDLKYRTAWNHIRSRRSYDLTIHTRSDLIGHDDYISVLDKQYHSILIHVLSDNEELNRNLEPGAPSFARRLKAFDKLKQLGFEVQLVHDLLVNTPGLNLNVSRPCLVNRIELPKSALARVSKALGFNVSQPPRLFTEADIPF